MNFFNRISASDFKSARRDVIIGDLSTKKAPNHYLRIAPKYVDLLCDLPAYCDLTTGQLFKLLPKRYHAMVPPIGEDLEIREAARLEEERMARAVIIGMLATEIQIEHHLAQKFVERL